MQTFTHRSSTAFIPAHNSDSLIFLDIETTGLSADYSTLFMIGCGYYKNALYHSIHWMADSLELCSEQEILQAFSFWLTDYTSCFDQITLITYNGETFDLPFLNKRFDACHIPNPFDQCITYTHTDYFRKLSAYKTLWQLKNLKQQTIGKWLEYPFSNTPSSRGLIKTYHAYIKTKDPVLLNLLFLHNIDDLESLSHILSLNAYFKLFDGHYTVTSMNTASCGFTMHVSLHTEYLFPKELSLTKENCHLSIKHDCVDIDIPIYAQGLRYYYSDIKSYVYLPAEDYALHKTMAKYIDKSHWVKATKDNCYTWFSPDETFFNDASKQKNYIQMILNRFISF